MNKFLSQYQFSLVFIAFLLLPSTFSSCKKFLSIPPPVDQVVSTEVFQNDKSALAAIAGLYSKIMQNEAIISFYLTANAGLLADELTNNVPADPFLSNALLPSTPEVNAYWSQCYSYIYLANSIIEGAQKSSDITPAVKSQLVGEAILIRAFVYFYVLNLWGDAPLVTTTDYRANAGLARTPASEISDQVVKDLVNAEGLLVDSYPSVEKNRANKWAATALLARVYLYRSQWDKAESEATAVINSGLYLPLPSVKDAFLKNNREAIWQLSPVNPSFNTFDGKYFIEPTRLSLPAYCIAKSLLNAFEPGDLRRTYWLDSSMFSGSVYYFPFKYKEPADASQSEYYTLLRLSEQFLIRAEARINTNNPQGALEDINVIRSRAALPILPTTLSKDQIISALEHERKVELFCEFGHRWFDLKRTGKADAILSSLKPGWKATDVFWPIPSNQIQLNSSLTQNAGY